MSKDEALKLALEALNSFPHRHLTPLVSDARITLREALAQPQQEPVAWMNAKRDMTYLYGPYNADDIPLYTSPQPAQRKPLTDEEIKGIYEDCDAPTGGQFTLAFTRAIEAAHGIKEKT